MALFSSSLLIFLSVFVILLQSSLSAFISWEDFSTSNYSTKGVEHNQLGSGILVVSKDGSGNSKTVQGAIDMVPQGNSQRVKILIYPGIYRQVSENIFFYFTKPSFSKEFLIFFRENIVFS